MVIRKSQRLPNKTLYKWNNLYFITICTHNRKCIFTNPVVAPDTVGHINDTHILPLTEIGKIIKNVRYQLPNMFWNIILDTFIIMPNHFHGIIGFNGEPYSKFTNKSTNLWNIIKRFKLETISLTKKHSHLLSILPIRQNSFHDHIIRNEEEFIRIQQYIINNPLQRTQDSLYINTLE